MTATRRTDPLAPAGLVLPLLPFPLGLIVDVDWWWRLAAAVLGGLLGLVALLRIDRSEGRLTGTGLAITASAVGLGIAGLIVTGLAFTLGVFLAAGSSRGPVL